MTPIIVAFFIACTNAPDVNGNLPADCLVAACPNVTKAIGEYVAQNKGPTKLTRDDKLDLGKMIIWHNAYCRGKG